MTLRDRDVELVDDVCEDVGDGVGDVTWLTRRRQEALLQPATQ